MVLDTSKTVRKIVDRLIQSYHPDKIILFGSHAYGQPRTDSDLDLLVIKDTAEAPQDRRTKVQQVIKTARGPTRVDVFVLTPAELDHELRKGNHFYQEVVSRGIHLYGEKEDYPMVEDSTPYAGSWLSIALDDLQGVELVLDHGGSGNVAGMLLQQAVEKYLKGYLILRGWRLERIHNLEVLLDKAIEYDPTFEEFREFGRTITTYYGNDRYPDADRTDLTREGVGASLEGVRPMIQKILEQYEGQQR